MAPGTGEREGHTFTSALSQMLVRDVPFVSGVLDQGWRDMALLFVTSLSDICHQEGVCTWRQSALSNQDGSGIILFVHLIS